MVVREFELGLQASRLQIRRGSWASNKVAGRSPETDKAAAATATTAAGAAAGVIFRLASEWRLTCSESPRYRRPRPRQRRRLLFYAAELNAGVPAPRPPSLRGNAPALAVGVCFSLWLFVSRRRTRCVFSQPRDHIGRRKLLRTFSWSDHPLSLSLSSSSLSI